MNGSATFRETARALRHLAGGRWLEVLLLQASPLLGAAFGGASAIGLGLVTLALGSVLLTAHVFVFNDWAGHHGDLNDPDRASRVFARHGIRSGTVAAIAVVLLAAAMVALAALGFTALVLGAAIACLGILYSNPQTAGKGVPVLASLLHLVGGAFHFLLGYQVARAIDARGLAIALFFGLVFAGGHLNQEVRDHDADRRNGIRTTAVVLGPRRALLASLGVFSAAYWELALLAAIGVVPRPLLWASALLWPLHAFWSSRALRSGPGIDQARWLQRRYRVLFAIVGVVMLLSLAAPVARSDGKEDSVPRVVDAKRQGVKTGAPLR
jgi:4-hydroxybenzoate polyprenyltransferase